MRALPSPRSGSGALRGRSDRSFRRGGSTGGDGYGRHPRQEGAGRASVPAQLDLPTHSELGGGIGSWRGFCGAVLDAGLWRFASRESSVWITCRRGAAAAGRTPMGHPTNPVPTPAGSSPSPSLLVPGPVGPPPALAPRLPHLVGRVQLQGSPQDERRLCVPALLCQQLRREERRVADGRAEGSGAVWGDASPTCPRRSNARPLSGLIRRAASQATSASSARPSFSSAAAQLLRHFTRCSRSSSSSSGPGGAAGRVAASAPQPRSPGPSFPSGLTSDGAVQGA